MNRIRSQRGISRGRWPLAVLVALLAGGLPQEAAADEEVAITRLGDDLFAAGGEIRLREAVAGDALVAGGRIDLAAEIAGDAAVAGGEVTLEGRVGEDLYAAGGELDIDAQVGGSARIAGGRVRIGRSARFDGGASLAGGTVELQGTFGRYVTVSGGQVRLAGRMLGDVVVYTESLEVAPGTQIDGTLTYHTPRAITLPADVVVKGGVRHVDADAEGSQWRRGRQFVGALGWLWLAGLFVAGVVIALIVPALLRRTDAALGARPLLALGTGLLVLIAVPAAVVVLAITLVGIPLALILLLLYLLALLVAYLVGAWFLAERALGALRRGAPQPMGLRLLAFALALVVLALLAFVPVLGGLVRFVVLLLGLGALALVAFAARRPPAAAMPAAI